MHNFLFACLFASKELILNIYGKKKKELWKTKIFKWVTHWWQVRVFLTLAERLRVGGRARAGTSGWPYCLPSQWPWWTLGPQAGPLQPSAGSLACLHSGSGIHHVGCSEDASTVHNLVHRQALRDNSIWHCKVIHGRVYYSSRFLSCRACG